MTLTHPRTNNSRLEEVAVQPLFGLEGTTIPRHQVPEHEMAPDVAYQIIHDELMLDGNARLNVATFVTTWMEPQAEKLMTECFDKNMIDKDEYPQTAAIEARCVNMLSRLWHAPESSEATGCSTTGSSEAAMLGGLALKRRWQKRRKAEGKSADRPNLVMGINVQVCWEKLANYWDVEMRLVPMEGDRYILSAEEAVKLCDENTIGVIAILGSTFDGSYEPVEEICAALDTFEAETGLDIPVHVDGASGAFVAPFVDPDLVWDFQLPRVASINASGHKYGLVYPGVGWVVWRDSDALPEDLIFWVNYLGDNMPTFALNFSRPGAQVVAQYYNFLRLGFEGYRNIQAYARDVATRLSSEIEQLGPFELLTRGDELPVFAFTLADDVDNFTVFDVSNAMRERGWQVPAYTFPKNREDLAALRVVVRRGFTHDMADLLLADMRRQLPRLQQQQAPQHDEASAAGFRH
jgi:glutamate decarboxylase